MDSETFAALLFDYGTKMRHVGQLQAEQNEYKELQSLYFELGDNARRVRREANELYDMLVEGHKP